VLFPPTLLPRLKQRYAEQNAKRVRHTNIGERDVWKIVFDNKKVWSIYLSSSSTCQKKQ